MARRTIPGLRAIVTGASSGIGSALARELALQGAHVLLTARRDDRLQLVCDEIKAAGGAASFVSGDITAAAVRQQLLAAAQSEWQALDLLVNNAGIGAWGPFAAADETRLRTVMEVNFFAPLELTRAALPLLAAGRQPLIVNVSSVLGHRAVPLKSEYCASKFALHGFSDALRAELAPRGIDVLLVSPSTTRSEFFQNVLGDAVPSSQDGWLAMPADAVARKAVKAIRRGSHEVILSPGGKLLVWLDRLCPPLADWLVGRYGRR